MQNKAARPSVKILLVVVICAIAIALILTGRHYFTRRGIRQMERSMSSYGTFSPIAVFTVLALSIIIPPLPIPTPLLEMAAGYMYGFWPSFFLIWAAQICSSFVAFAFSHIIGKRVFKTILKNPMVALYQQYIREHGATAVFLSRTTMSSPFSLVSFLAGLTDMKFAQFALATIFGTIVESALFSYIGALLQGSHVRLWYVFIFVVILGGIGPIITYYVIRYQRNAGSRLSRTYKHPHHNADK